jgi:hypothetical protein
MGKRTRAALGALSACPGTRPSATRPGSNVPRRIDQRIKESLLLTT